MSGSSRQHLNEVIPSLLAALAEQRKESAGNPPVPDEHHLRAMLDAAYFASLVEEEGHTYAFSLAWLPTEEGSEGGAVQLRAAVPLDVARLAKLAPATHPRETMLAVRSTAGGELQIWGFVHVGDRVFHGELSIRPHFFHVTAYSPGSIEVRSGSRTLLLYSRGIAHFRSYGEARITDLLRDTLHDYSRKTGGGQLANQLDRLGTLMVRSGHGGSIILLEPNAFDGDASPAGLSIPNARRFFPPDLTLHKAFQATEQPAEPRLRAREGRNHEAALRHVANLARVDGAVVMGADLRVFGFGATVELSADDLEIRLVDRKLADANDAEKEGTLTSVKTLGLGHRHKAAADFCQRQFQRGGDGLAIVLVASQDGQLSLFGKIKSGVVVHRPFQIYDP